MTEPKRRPGRPRKNPSPAPAVATQIPNELASPAVVKALDRAGLTDAAHVLGEAIADADQEFRDEVRDLCKSGMPVTFKFDSLAESAQREQIVSEMAAPIGMRYAIKRTDSRLEVALRSAR